MRLYIVLAFIATTALAERRPGLPELVVKHNSYKENCKPGDTWKDQDCNRCNCDEDKKAVCTKRKCPGGEKLTPTDGWQDVFTPQSATQHHERRKRSEKLVVKPDSYADDCKPGDRWMDQDCNECACGDDKQAVCSRKLCSDGKRLTPTEGWQDVFTNTDSPQQQHHERRKRSEKLVVKPDSYADDCKPGDRWRDQDCNDCVCDDDKEAVCSRMLCPDGKRLTPTEGWQDVFTPNSNSQHQHHERRKRADVMVVKPNSYKDDCRPGDTWRDQDCNKCRCEEDKKPVCTRKKCSSGEQLTPTDGWKNIFTPESGPQQHHPDDLTCEEGKTWKMDCNTCSCVNGLPACTEMACKPDHSHHKRSTHDSTCEEGTSWKMDCNTCTCVNGLPACTEMACKPDHSNHKRDARNQLI